MTASPAARSVRPAAAHGGGRLHGGALRVIADCHFAVQLNQFMPGLLSYLVTVFSRKMTIGFIPRWTWPGVAGTGSCAVGESRGAPRSSPFPRQHGASICDRVLGIYRP
jgi:hypothetical protein